MKTQICPAPTSRASRQRNVTAAPGDPELSASSARVCPRGPEPRLQAYENRERSERLDSALLWSILQWPQRLSRFCTRGPSVAFPGPPTRGMPVTCQWGAHPALESIAQEHNPPVTCKYSQQFQELVRPAFQTISLQRA